MSAAADLADAAIRAATPALGISVAGGVGNAEKDQQGLADFKQFHITETADAAADPAPTDRYYFVDLRPGRHHQPARLIDRQRNAQQGCIYGNAGDWADRQGHGHKVRALQHY